MEAAFTGDVMEKHDELFMNGSLSSKGSPNAFGWGSMVAKCIWLGINGRQMHLAGDQWSPNAFGCESWGSQKTRHL